MEALLGVVLGFYLAYANGANDNFKGVATLFGSGTTNYRKALWWATITTAAGSVTALFFAQALLTSFTGKGLVAPELVQSAGFALSVAFAAASTVMLATRLGFPISTTHSLVGALVGAGLVGPAAGVNWDRLASAFMIPLLISPFIAVAAAVILYPLFSRLRSRLGVNKDTCLCLGQQVLEKMPATVSMQGMSSEHIDLRRIQLAAEMPQVKVADEIQCRQYYRGDFLGLRLHALLDALHFLSAGLVSFARGLNDTPKIAAVLLAGAAISPSVAIAGVAVFMATGAILSARRVAETLSLKITTMNHGQGLTANIITGVLVIFASRMGVPVSTTHVSCGSLFGIGAVTGQGHWAMIGRILLSWLITLPVAGCLAAAFSILSRGGFSS